VEKLVSIIIPVYNVERHLTRCLESVISQSYRNIEIIVINDGSPDNSQEIIDSFAQKDSRIRPFSQKNTGLSGARNTGMKHANGDYLYFLDSDDFISSNAIEKLISGSNNADIVIGNYSIYENEKRITQREAIPNRLIPDAAFSDPQFKFDFFFGKNYGLCAWNKLYKAAFIQRLNLLFEKNSEIYAEDLLFNAKCFVNSPTIYLVNEYTYFHCINPESITRTYKEGLHFRFLNLMASFREYALSLDVFEENTDLLAFTACIAISNICLNNYLYTEKSFKKIYQDIEWLYPRLSIPLSLLTAHLTTLRFSSWKVFHVLFFFFYKNKHFGLATALQYCRFVVRYYYGIFENIFGKMALDIEK